MPRIATRFVDFYRRGCTVLPPGHRYLHQSERQAKCNRNENAVAFLDGGSHHLPEVQICIRTRQAAK